MAGYRADCSCVRANNHTYSKIKGLYNDHQHGFRPHRGTQIALGLLNQTTAIHRGNDSRVHIVLRDISRAFDKVWPNGLMFKLLDGSLLDCLTRLICDYMRDRTAKIWIDDYYGPTFALRSEVPQGRCLSTTLFCYYTHDIPDSLDNSQYISYADDMTQIVPYPAK